MCKILKAYCIAKKAHKGQKDKGGKPYIKHPVYVAKRVKGRDAKIVALLHDTIEDTSVTYDYIKSVFGDRIAESVKVLTKDKTISYEEYISNYENVKEKILLNTELEYSDRLEVLEKEIRF